MSADEFRSVLGRFAGGVTIVTATDDQGEAHGMTASAFCSVSLEPPLVLVCIDHQAAMHDMLQTVPSFAVNILAESQEPLARRFSEPGGGRFDGIGFRPGRRGAPLLDDAVGQLECNRVAAHEGGDHTIFIGEPVACTIGDGMPLLYYRGGYAQLSR